MKINLITATADDVDLEYRLENRGRGVQVILEKNRNKNILDSQREIIDALKGDFALDVKDHGTYVAITVKNADYDEVEEVLDENL